MSYVAAVVYATPCVQVGHVAAVVYAIPGVQVSAARVGLCITGQAMLL